MSSLRILTCCLLYICVFAFFSGSCQSQVDSDIDLQPKKAWWGRWGYVNSANKFILEPQYEEALPFGDFLAPVKV
ncbi:MAG: WG repeat-containing protein, partial [Verrucomicrobia bacterium]|nr:WG repeat-containing protein [Verrucomicrobiota bacterium]